LSGQAYEQVLHQIESMLTSKQLGVGDHLESERALADRLGVSRPSVREAVRVLTALGLVRSAPGSGPSAGAQIVAEPETALTATLRLHMATSSLSIPDVIDTRIMLETWAYRRLGGPPGEALEPAAALLEEMDEAVPGEFHRLDAQFHRELVRLAGNPLVSAVMSSLRAAIEGYVLAAVPAIGDWASTAARLQREHRAILDAIAAGRGETAARLAEQHILDFARQSGLIPPERVPPAP
jgi:GntR family transcriptional repressor for pyruvate dehydrogenase complex